MKLISNLFRKQKDGGSDSPVDAYFLIESKPLISIALLKFNKGGREEFHTHAFNALTWFLKGDLIEEDFDGDFYIYTPSLLPKITTRTKNHRVIAIEDSWCLTIRGRWVDHWTEHSTDKKIKTTLTHGRIVIGESL